MTTPDPARWITTEPIALDPLLRETEDPACGALAVFGGIVRDHNDDRSVDGMTYDAHVAMAARALAELERRALARFDIARCRVVHRYGPLDVGEPSVWVVVRSAHRAPAFEAARWLIDTLKEELPVWKEEHYLDGASRHLPGTPLTPSSDD